jgi:hypothetical protein
MINFFDAVKNDPSTYKQLHSNDLLVTEFNCTIQKMMCGGTNITLFRKLYRFSVG